MKLTIEDNQRLLDILYSTYILNLPRPGKETSSHWKQYGGITKIEKISNSKYELSGIGFGDYSKRTPFNYLKNIPSRFFLNKLIRELEPTIASSLFIASKKSNRLVSFDCVKHALIINKLSKLGLNFNGMKICIIGDGYGFLGILLKQHFPEVQILSVNLGKILFFDAAITSMAFPKANMLINTSMKISNSERLDFEFIPAEILQSPLIKDIDIFFNISSMQEMNLSTINQYMKWIYGQEKFSTYFYCCNRETKNLPDGTVINFNDYGWKDSDKILLDEQCDWYTTYPINRPPFAQNFDGAIRHKLIHHLRG